MSKQRRISVLVVDDSPLVRKVIRELLEADPAIGVVETAPDGRLALRKVAKLQPDVVTLDVEMPHMDGIATLRHIMKSDPRPVLMLSAHTTRGAEQTMRALELGAVDFIPKPTGRLTRDILQVGDELVRKVKAVACRHPQRRSGSTREGGSKPAAASGTAGAPSPRVLPPLPAEASGPHDLIVIGASTGGTHAIRAILTTLPADLAARVLVVQHMPEGFTRSFARRLDELSAIDVKEADHHDMARLGRVLVAPGHSHMVARTSEIGDYVELLGSELVNGHRPSVDVLFESAAAAFGPRAVGVLLTGMGRDGATGLGALRAAGALTIAQDEASCVVFGMPRAAIKEGAAQVVAELTAIPDLLIQAVRGGRHT